MKFTILSAPAVAALALFATACAEDDPEPRLPDPPTSVTVAEETPPEPPAEEEPEPAPTPDTTTSTVPEVEATTTTAATTTTSLPVLDPPHVVEFGWGEFSLARSIGDRLFVDERLTFVLSMPSIDTARTRMAEQGWSRGVDEVSDVYERVVLGRVIGPESSDARDQASELVSLVEAGEVDCLVVDADGDGLVADAVDTAVAAGVPVFTLGTDVPNSRRFAFYGLDDFDAGRFAGSFVGRWVLDKRILILKAGVLASDPDDRGARARMEGFVEAFLEVQPHVEFVNSADTVEPQGVDADEIYESAAVWLAENPDVDVILHADAGLEPLARVISDQYLHGDVYAVGFGMSETVGNLIHDGVIVASLVEGVAAQAATAAVACGEFLLEGVHDVGVVARTPQVAHEFNLESFGWSPPGLG